MNQNESQHMIEESEQRLYALLPHRPPMLLIDKLISVSQQASHSQVMISNQSAFFSQGHGVPNWIGIEYMGQTAALIAGYQLENNLVQPHLGFLLGTRKFTSNIEYFEEGLCLDIRCSEKAVVGDNLATFECIIENNRQTLAHANISVYRKPLN